MCKTQFLWKFHQELLSYCPWFDLIMLVLTTPPTVSVWFTLNLAEVFIRSCRCARRNFRENSMKNCWVVAPDSHYKCLSGQLLLQFQSHSLFTWQKCPFGVIDVQDANFMKITSRITKLLPLIWLKKCLSWQLLLQFLSDSLYTWQKFSLGDEDVQFANFVKVLWRIYELLPLIPF